ncbi:UV-damage endonuclease [Talaromyces proteolyticus]|uniref:UV-damage endonuclease n=1 Tax=Talaromyces proteolyticus TaxID=1131652 RepID=A0AAD4PSZ2_9EURO|nr:UV-damage endonuclease [Talaromyces proteolyticus]KAH8692291.1 UV-damage endonuclease [Talaromyces proteolyticus]
MDRSATRAAAARIRRGVHTSSPKRVSPAAVEPVESALSNISAVLESGPRTGKKKAAPIDPESDEEVPTNAAEVQESLARPPPVNSDYLPLPWKGRLGYACLNTYLRYANPPVFSSRTCRIASILENRHPLQDPSQPYHSTKNRPDRSKPAVIARGQEYVQSLGVANARDIVKMLRWNDRYGIKFMRLSSEMFPFASHDVYGYKLAPFASEVLADAGRVAAELGHRLTMHPGQFTQLGSPRKEVIENSIRDLEFHSELLQLLKLPPQQNRDAVMILHMGGVFGDKGETLDRFRKNYKTLSQDIKNRLVLENDDVSWSVHDLLPICEELNIPLVLDFHHHNIVFDSDKLREGTLDIMQLYDRIRATWTRKNITQKMHYSEPTPDAITPRQRRKHNPRVATLPPCDPTMDLMIEAKDKEQAVFELMRKFKLPGYERISELTPHVREDENKPWKPPKRTKKSSDYIDLSKLTPPPLDVLAEEVSMGGPEGKVYWPPEHEEWLRPKKRVISRKQSFPLPDSVEFPQKKTKPRSTTNRKKRKSSRVSTPTSSSEKETLKPPPSARRSTRAKRVSYAEDNSA